ncbi:hypothetical protein BRC81_15855 [Halobacteriales archaeon QS_1_68_20]|nr:MAG: hypothetical protein BRC81_15855 [Halobacteriales archaeon QS_1_68_20]
MDREEFHEQLETLADDQEAFVAAIQERVRTLSGRHLDIQEEIQSSEQTREDLADRLEAVEDEIVAQADASVEQDVESIEDVEALPPDAGVEFDEELIEEVEEIRSQAKSNYRQTTERGADLQAELNENTEELELYGDVLARLEAEEISPAEARDRLLEFLDDRE